MRLRSLWSAACGLGSMRVCADTEGPVESRPALASLLDLVKAGIEHDAGGKAAACVADLRAELAEVTDVPVLLAVDEYDSWFEPSDYS